MSSLEFAAQGEAMSSANAAIPPSALLLLRRAFRIMRGCGISPSQLDELSKQALGDLHGLPTRPLGSISASQALISCDVVLKWRRDCKFLDADGLPLALSTGGGSPSFQALVLESAGGNDPNELLQVMLQLGVIRHVDASRVELISDSVVACGGREETEIAGETILEHVCGFLGSVEFNVFDKPSRTRGKFERACYAWVPRRYVPVLEQLVNSRGQDFVDVIDEWLSRRAVPLASHKDDSVLVGAGAYVFVRNRFGDLGGLEQQKT